MRRRFNPNLLPTSWEPVPKSYNFCPKRFAVWVKNTQFNYGVNTVMMEDWGFNSQTLVRWRKAKQIRTPTHGAILKFCDGIRTLSYKTAIIEELLVEAAEHMKQQ